MIDENKCYGTKSKLAITVQILNKCNDRSKLAVKQTNAEIQKLENI